MMWFDTHIDGSLPELCNSGGAIGADTIWEECSVQYGLEVRAWSHNTPSHKSPNKMEVSDEDFKEGIEMVKRALKTLRRTGVGKYMDLLARNWAQVKYSDAVYAVGTIISPGKRDDRGYINQSTIDIVSGGTGYAVQMAIDEYKPVFVYDQSRCGWFKYSFLVGRFVPLQEPPVLYHRNFAGIGTRKLNRDGEQAIRDIFKRTFDEDNR